MHKDWLWISLASVLLAACSTTEQQTAPLAPQAWEGPVVDIPGVEPKYEALNSATNQDYRVNGKRYRIIQEPGNYSEVGLAAWYGEEARGSRTASGETYDPDILTAAHPTLPLPGYVRVTNLANGRQLVVRINDRGPYAPGRIIKLSTAAGNRLNISANTRVRVDYIKVAPDGTLSGPGTVGTRVSKQNFALPARPDITSDMPAGSNGEKAEDASVMASNNGARQRESGMGSPVNRNGFLVAPQPLRSEAPESSEATASPSFASQNNFVVQVGAISDAARARQWMENLSKRFGVPGVVEVHGRMYRVQLGRFSNRQQAIALQQRLLQESRLPSFVTVAADRPAEP